MACFPDEEFVEDRVATNFLQANDMRRRVLVGEGDRIFYSSGSGESVRSVINDKNASSEKVPTKLKGSVTDIAGLSDAYAISDAAGNLSIFSKYPSEPKQPPALSGDVKHTHLAWVDKDTLITLASDKCLREYRVSQLKSGVEGQGITVVRNAAEPGGGAPVYNALSACPKKKVFAAAASDCSDSVELYSRPAGAESGWKSPFSFKPFKEPLLGLGWLDPALGKVEANGRSSPSTPPHAQQTPLLLTLSKSMMLRVWDVAVGVESITPSLLLELALPTSINPSAARLTLNGGPYCMLYGDESLSLVMHFTLSDTSAVSVVVYRQDMTGVLEYCLPAEQVGKCRICVVDSLRLSLLPFKPSDKGTCTLKSVPFGSVEGRIACSALPAPAFAVQSAGKKDQPVVRQIASVTQALSKLKSQCELLKHVGTRLESLGDKLERGKGVKDKTGEQVEESYEATLAGTRTQLAGFAQGELSVGPQWAQQKTQLKETLSGPLAEFSKTTGAQLLSSDELLCAYHAYRGGPTPPPPANLSPAFAKQLQQYTGPTAADGLFAPEIQQLSSHPRTIARTVIAEEIIGTKKLESDILGAMGQHLKSMFAIYLQHADAMQKACTERLALVQQAQLPSLQASIPHYQLSPAFAELMAGLEVLREEHLAVKQNAVQKVASFLDQCRAEDVEENPLREDSVRPEDSISTVGNASLDQKAVWRRLIAEQQYNECVSRVNQHQMQHPDEDMHLQWFRAQTFDKRAEVARSLSIEEMVALLRDSWISVKDLPNDDNALEWIIALGEQVDLHAITDHAMADQLLPVINWGRSITADCKLRATPQQQERLDVVMFNLE
eukprot:TRINITY_DN16235_c0_g1_i1.p1 TRINITY_DN16235_c0_g1~~TRINITY_DN16235_c0_g1_i1.p1  ORF type:complete len:917 (+),score=277.08 TRINITY_DN16235_c0_g1_i1:243-2753(+)